MNDPDDSDWPLARGVELIQDISAISQPLAGYLRRHRHRVKTLFDDGTRSETYVADFMDRDPTRRDAIALAVYTQSPGRDVAATRILLRRQLRYAAYLAAGRPLTTEVIAGLIENGEAVVDTAVRELWEEASIRSEPRQIRPLGPPFFIIPGIFTERIFPLAAEVDAATLEQAASVPPPGDGSPFEEGSEMIVTTLGEAFELIDRMPSTDPNAPALDDAKTELLLTRLWRRLEGEAR